MADAGYVVWLDGDIGRNNKKVTTVRLCSLLIRGEYRLRYHTSDEIRTEKAVSLAQDWRRRDTSI